MRVANVCIVRGHVHVEALANRILFFWISRFGLGVPLPTISVCNICNGYRFLKVCGRRDDKGIPVSVELE